MKAGWILGCASEGTYINQKLDLVLLEITADLGRQKNTSSCTELTILLVQFTLKHKFFKIDKSHGHRRLLVATFILGQLFYLPFQTAGRWKTEKEKGRDTKTKLMKKFCQIKSIVTEPLFHLLILLSVSLIWGNFSLKVSFMSFLRSEGLTYSMTVVWKEKPEVVSEWPHFHHWAGWLDPHTQVLDSTVSPGGFTLSWC